MHFNRILLVTPSSKLTDDNGKRNLCEDSYLLLENLVIFLPAPLIWYAPKMKEPNSPYMFVVASFGGYPWSPWQQEASRAAVALCWTIPSMCLSWSRKFINEDVQPYALGLRKCPLKKHVVFLAIGASWLPPEWVISTIVISSLGESGSIWFGWKHQTRCWRCHSWEILYKGHLHWKMIFGSWISLRSWRWFFCFSRNVNHMHSKSPFHPLFRSFKCPLSKVTHFTSNLT